MSRQKFLSIYLPFIFILGMVIYFGLKFYSQKNFSEDKFQILVNTTNKFKDKTDDLCKYQILSEPKVEDQYIKINFWCQNQTKARSTLSLAAIDGNSVEDILKEYARIINFDYNLISQKQWYCLINDSEISLSNINQTVKAASTIDCFENKSLYRYDQKDLKLLVFLSVLIIALIIRKKDYAQIPIPGQSVDEYSYSWVGLSLLETGMPVGISGIPGYQHQYSKYINVDRLYQTLSSDPLSINYPWMDHPPLLGLITGGYAYLSGAIVFEDTTALLIRRPIIVIGTISVALLMIYVWINFNFVTSILSGLIYATTPLIVLSSRMIQAENAIIPCLLAVMICLSLFFKSKKDIWLILAGVISGIATLFKLTGVVCYLFVFLSLLYQNGKFNQKFFRDFGFYLLISLPISALYIFYGLAYGVKNFFAILFSNANRFYGIGPNAIIDLIRNQRLTQHKFLPEIWLIVGWFTFMFSALKKKKSSASFLIFIALIAYLIIYLFFGSQPYGWYTFPFWPLLILSLVSFFYDSLKKGNNILLAFFISLTLLGSNISRVIGIFDFQPISNLWRLIIPGALFLLVINYVQKKSHHFFFKGLIILFLLVAIYFNFRYLNLINIDYWWQNIS